MCSLVRVSLGLFLLLVLAFDPFKPLVVGVVARSIVKRALPHYMEYDQLNSQQQSPQNQHRTHIVKIHPKKSQRSNDEVLSDITSFRGIGDGHNAFGGPKYAGSYYPLMGDQGDRVRANNFSFGNLLSGLALWNLANEFNMYSVQNPHQLTPSSSNQIKTGNHHQLTNQFDQIQNNGAVDRS